MFKKNDVLFSSFVSVIIVVVEMFMVTSHVDLFISVQSLTHTL